MARIEIERDQSDGAAHSGQPHAHSSHLGERMLARNALWFVQLRWAIIGLLLVAQAAVLFFRPQLSRIGIPAQGFWLGAVAFVLAAANLWFSYELRGWTRRRRAAIRDLWQQIAVDLTSLTVVVHFLGSISTPAPFLYVFHTALACVFFSVGESLVVTVMAVGLYNMCVFLEYGMKVIPQPRITGIAAGEPIFHAWYVASHAAAISLVLLGVWAIVSRLSKMIREHQNRLLEADREILRAQEERDRYVRQVTHQLKAPLDAIRSNLMLLTDGYWGEQLPQDIVDVLHRTNRRAEALGEQILDALRLFRLKEVREKKEERNDIDLKQLLEGCVEDLKASAMERKVRIDTDLQDATVRDVEKRLQLLFSNLLSNAVNYSKSGGTVRVSCARDMHDGAVRVGIADEGIGIGPDELPRIFEESFRSKAAVKHNRESTGVGLAIVKRIVQTSGIHLTVDSEVDRGTTFELRFPPRPEAETQQSGHIDTIADGVGTHAGRERPQTMYRTTPQGN